MLASLLTRGLKARLTCARASVFYRVDNRGMADAVAKPAEKEPVKFTTSDAYLNYKSTRNFFGDDRDLPKSHNAVIASSCILGIFYLIFLRDDIDADGGAALIKPLHEQIPELAIPMLQAAIAEHRKLGYNTVKLEKKLAEYMKQPDKYGGDGHKLIEN